MPGIGFTGGADMHDELAYQWGSLYGGWVTEWRRGVASPDTSGADLLPNGFEPCLVTFFRLSVRQETAGSDARDHFAWFRQPLADRGHLARPAELAFRQENESFRGSALLSLVKAAADAGDLPGAQALADAIPFPQVRDDALVALIPAMVRAGEPLKAVAVAETTRFPHNWGKAWGLLAKRLRKPGTLMKHSNSPSVLNRRWKQAPRGWPECSCAVSSGRWPSSSATMTEPLHWLTASSISSQLVETIHGARALISSRRYWQLRFAQET